MKEIINIDDAKTIMKGLNVIIYGTIRDIENDFMSSFTNIDIMCQYFNKVFIIIFENDSKDKTRELLMEWSNVFLNKNTIKHIILKQDLDIYYPLRAHRLAYCRNLILNYICDNNLHHTYTYAIHCDLDNRFWSIDFDSICNSFQYDLNLWDMISCVNTNKTYYDYWALRCNSSWFNKNIFSCDANNINYETKTGEFYNLLKNTSGLLSTTSSFNGMGIYKVNSIVNCRYNANYNCSKCNNINRGCWEDNDHIGLHKQMINNNCNIFINTKMYITTRPDNCIPFNDFIDSIYIPSINKKPLNYMLINNMIDYNGKWIMFGLEDGDIANLITNYYNDVFYCFDEKLKYDNSLLLNKNIKHIIGKYEDSFENNSILFDIKFIYINIYKYQDLKYIFKFLYKKIKPGCIIIFNKLINYKEYLLNGIKLLYENIYNNELYFEWFLMNGEMNKNGSKGNEMVAIKIISKDFENKIKDSNIDLDYNYDNELDEDFDWEFYINNYSDLKHINSRKESYHHWINHGKKEGRIGKLINKLEDDNFDWEMYIDLNPDIKSGLKSLTKEEAMKHWINNGKKEGRVCNFDWCLYVKNYNLVSKCIDTKFKAMQHWSKNGKPIIKSESDHDYDKDLFNWEYYVNKYSDLKDITSRDLAWNHWITHGKKEGRVSYTFKWTNYLLLNSDLIEAGINTEALALSHYVNHGKMEKRKIN